MKIAILGVSGGLGSHVALEAKRRRHDVTAIVCDPAEMPDEGYGLLRCEPERLKAEELESFHAVVDARCPQRRNENVSAYLSSLRQLTEVMEQLPHTRLLVAGDSATLCADLAREHTVLDKLPRAKQAVALSMKAALDCLKASAARWTYFSPALNFDPQGPRTGRYDLGADFVIPNGGNESYISYADCAVALLDELEEGRFIRRRFTAAAEKTPDKDGYYGTEKTRPVFEGVSQYCSPLNYELEGRFFHLTMDTTPDIDLRFLTGKEVEYSQDGTTTREDCQCAKGAELAYFVNIVLKGSKPRMNVVVILDLQTRLATVVKTSTGFKEEYPTLCDSNVDFGAIDLPRHPLPLKRHGYTADLIGKRIQWHYTPDFAIVHCYYHPNYIRATYTPEAYKRLPPGPDRDLETWAKHPYDEKAVYIKIRDGLYLLCFTEHQMAKRKIVGNSLAFLINTDKLHDVGRSFGHTGQFNGRSYLPENYLFSAYGEFVKTPDGDMLDCDPPFYTV